ncbi:MAG: hypothetical protein ACK5WZ_06660, partial [Pseudobdellovibrionaceae bacterium]
KQMIEKFDNRKTRAKSANNSVQRRYVDIEDDGSEENFPEDQFKSMKTLNTMNLEAARASREGQNQEARQTQDRFDLDVIKSLQGEIKTLKQIITQFQNVPQNIKNSTYPGADYGLTYE